MSRFIAFLRAINVGGHTVKMDRLRQLFEAFGFSNVETFIASGNVIFETPARKARSLERKIEQGLGEALGYEVATFIRTETELAGIAAYSPFPQFQVEAAASFSIAFLADELDGPAQKKLLALRTAIDDFHIHGREFSWLSRQRQSDSVISNALLEKTLGRRTTLRGVNTIRRLAERYSSSKK